LSVEFGKQQAGQKIALKTQGLLNGQQKYAIPNF
jgi:hypothetical protein